MLVRVRPGAPLPVKTGHHGYGGIAVPHDRAFQRRFAALDVDGLVVHADIVDQQPDIGFSQRRVSASQLLADQIAEFGDRFLADALRSSFKLERQAARAGAQLRDVLAVLGEPLGELRVLGRHQTLLEQFQQPSYALFRFDFLPPDTIEILVPLRIRRIGFLEYGLQQFEEPIALKDTIRQD
ncbi:MULTISPECIES: hypothetical protein [Sphingomonas]|uniref:Uncharacterized protein n=1 Tax=Sphingomonas zeae TaxID=1646122 RepID=A0A7Y6B481_9SPHN|nr:MULTISPECIES: hypothetical protein [Sphingomonas]MDK8187516.1 hypothetical protein [Sphingomonas zeae]MDK8217250.1 hypothetical protein [Sphingomonas sp. UMB7805-LC452B]NUU46157.1 hypothetical protein [Sphingomonas zeae]